MHICFISDEYPKRDYPHGGIGTFIKALGEALVLSGNNVSVIGIGYRDFNEHENDHGIEIYRIATAKAKKARWFLNSRKISKQIDKINSICPINIIETAEMGLAFIKKRDDIYYILRLHGGHHFFSEAEKRGINWRKGFKERRSFVKADKIIGVSNYVLHQTAKYINFENKRGPVIYNPIDLGKFYMADPQKSIKGRIFFAGTVSEKKGIRQLIQALPLIKKEVPSAHLVIAGRDSKLANGTSYTTWLKQFIDEEIRKATAFLGPINNDEIPELIEKADVCVYPSHMESFGLAWLEVLAMGKALVASNVGPGSEIVMDGLTGLLCNPLDPESIADKTIKLLKNPDLGISLGKAARTDVIRRFAIEGVVKQNIDFYNSLL